MWPQEINQIFMQRISANARAMGNYDTFNSWVALTFAECRTTDKETITNRHIMIKMILIYHMFDFFLEHNLRCTLAYVSWNQIQIFPRLGPMM